MILTREKGKRMWGGLFSETSGSGGGEGGSGGVTPAWIDSTYLSKEFFNQLFVVHINTKVTVTDGMTTTETNTPGVMSPNDVIPEDVVEQDVPSAGYTTTTHVSIESIEAKSNFWSSLAISALGQGSGGGGGAVALADLVDVAISNPTNGQVLMYNSTTQKWYNGTVQSGGGSVTSITAGTGLSGGTITSSGTIAISSTYQSYISHGETAYQWIQGNPLSGYATKSWVQDQGYLTSSDISDMATQTWVGQQGFLTSVSGTFWGNSWSNGGTLSGNIIIDNGYAIRFKNSSGDNKNVLTLNSSNQLAIGYNTRQMGYVTDIQGDPITFATNNGTTGGTNNRLEVGEFSSAGRFWIKQGTQGLRIGDGLIIWDSYNNALRVQKFDATAANLYADGAVSALGFSSGNGSTTIDNLTVNSSVKMEDYASSSLNVLSVTKATSATTVNYLNIGEDWSALYHDTRIYGYNVQLVSGNGAYIMSMNGSGKVTFPNYIQASRFYLDSSRYIYLSGSSLYYYNGSTSIQIA